MNKIGNNHMQILGTIILQSCNPKFWQSCAESVCAPSRITTLNNFSRLIGRGHYGRVYRGRRETETIAVKVLQGASTTDQQWAFERSIEHRFHHKNVLWLLGYGSTIDRSELYLIYPYFPMKLENHMTGLGWPTTLKVFKGIASGLEHIHGVELPRIIHCDIKPDNILLDSDMNPIISDFGTATREGLPRAFITLGYNDPLTQFESDRTTDIFSFGVIMLELIMGRRCLQDNEHIERYANRVRGSRKHHLFKSSLIGGIGGCSVRDAKRITKLALRCVRPHVPSRPQSASEIVDILQTIEASAAGRALSKAKNFTRKLMI